ncbi:MAG: hypothetical protein G8345_07395 [Magnetococcales bacterium]|nr:CZB domain-containing protein [Magnetococcales bacterium]NGZ26698.1 hypothetical protein [Magnetococcales bacterium]
MPTLTLDLVEKWYVWLKDKLVSFMDEGKPFFEANKVVLFPDALPYNTLGLAPGHSAALEKLHSEICSLARMSVALEANNRHGTRVALEQAISHIGKALALLRDHAAPKKEAPPAKATQFADLESQHSLWFTQFKRFMEENMESGNFHNEEIRALSNYRQCPIGQWLYEEKNHLWFNCNDAELLAMETNHKHLHAITHVEAQLACQLRRKGLNSLELYRLKEQIVERVNQLEKQHQAFLDHFGKTYNQLAKSSSALQTFNQKSPFDFIPWDRLRKDVADWKEKILRYDGSAPDRELEESLSHAGCPTGKRIEYALSNPSLYFLNEFGLKLLDSTHMQFHVTGSVIYTLVQMGYAYDACALFNTLNEEEKDLLEHLKQNAQLLKISNAA